MVQRGILAASPDRTAPGPSGSQQTMQVEDRSLHNQLPEPSTFSTVSAITSTVLDYRTGILRSSRTSRFTGKTPWNFELRLTISRTIPIWLQSARQAG